MGGEDLAHLDDGLQHQAAIRFHGEVGGCKPNVIKAKLPVKSEQSQGLGLMSGRLMEES